VFTKIFMRTMTTTTLVDDDSSGYDDVKDKCGSTPEATSDRKWGRAIPEGKGDPETAGRLAIFIAKGERPARERACRQLLEMSAERAERLCGPFLMFVRIYVTKDICVAEWMRLALAAGMFVFKLREKDLVLSPWAGSILAVTESGLVDDDCKDFRLGCHSIVVRLAKTLGLFKMFRLMIPRFVDTDPLVRDMTAQRGRPGGSLWGWGSPNTAEGHAQERGSLNPTHGRSRRGQALDRGGAGARPAAAGADLGAEIDLKTGRYRLCPGCCRCNACAHCVVRYLHAGATMRAVHSRHAVAQHTPRRIVVRTVPVREA